MFSHSELKLFYVYFDLAYIVYIVYVLFSYLGCGWEHWGPHVIWTLGYHGLKNTSFFSKYVPPLCDVPCPLCLTEISDVDTRLLISFRQVLTQRLKNCTGLFHEIIIYVYPAATEEYVGNTCDLFCDV